MGGGMDSGPWHPALSSSWAGGPAGPRAGRKEAVKSRWTPRGPSPGSLCLLAKDGWSSGLSVPKDAVVGRTQWGLGSQALLCTRLKPVPMVNDAGCL